jgi:hypothetical protein
MDQCHADARSGNPSVESILTAIQENRRATANWGDDVRSFILKYRNKRWHPNFYIDKSQQ